MCIGEYETTAKLGEGGMSEVYEAVNPRLGSRFAVKLYSYPKKDDTVRERFLVEGRLLAKLTHPRLVKVADIGEDQYGRPFFAMDLVLNPEGRPQTLADALAEPLDEEIVSRWYDDIREGLRYIHAQGVVHRDLKLQNVLIGPDGHAVLTDFGISRVFKAGDDEQTVVDAVQTLVSVRNGSVPVMGSLGYMAPELEMGVAASPKSDWYALGVIVFKLLTGTWCDSRTDVVGELETYDPVWRRIVPKLLHANPEGRECLSFAEEKAKDREEAEFASEERWLKEKRRGHLARHVARYLFCLTAILGILTGVFGYRMVRAERQLALPVFDTFFDVPSYIVDEDAREDYRAAICDAWFLTRDDFADIRDESLGREAVCERLDRLARHLARLAASEDLTESVGFDLKCPDDAVVARVLNAGASRIREWLRQQ